MSLVDKNNPVKVDMVSRSIFKTIVCSAQRGFPSNTNKEKNNVEYHS